MSKIKDSLKFIGQQLKNSVVRFPITLGITSIFVVVAIILTHLNYSASGRDDLERILFALAIGIPMTAAAKLIIERFSLKGLQMGLAQGAVLLLVLVYYFTIPETFNNYFVMRFMALWSILFLSFLIIPYFYAREGLSRYVLHLVGRFFLTMLYAGVILGGISMMIFTIQELFGVEWPDEIYIDLFIILAGAFGVTHFLGSIPELDTEIKTSDYSKIFKSLFLFIVLPIVSVYTLILYAYFIKIIFNFKLPEGIIGNLVLWYALVSVATLFFIRDLKSEVSWLTKFYKIYIPLMIVPLGMLFIAIGIRIDAYGLTMPRYFVVALALFSTISLAIMWIKKQDTAVATLVLLVAFISVSFFGVLSGYTLTLNNQMNHLEKLFQENDLQDENGNVVPSSKVPEAMQIEISEKIDFLLNNYEPESVSILPENFTRANAKEFLGFEMTYYRGYGINQNYFNINTKGYSKVVDLSGADYLVMANHYESIEKTSLDDTYSLSKANDDGIVVIYKGTEKIMEIDIEKAAAQFYLDQSKLVVVTSPDASFKATLDFISLDGRILSDETPTKPEDLQVDYFEVRILMDIE